MWLLQMRNYFNYLSNLQQNKEEYDLTETKIYIESLFKVGNVV